MALVRCPTCSTRFDPQRSPALPFCSDRCRQIDLGRWLNEEISMPLGELSEEDAGNDWSDKEDDDE